MTDNTANVEFRVSREIVRIERNRKVVRLWLAVVLLAIFAQVLLGGATRLTHSGLSITEWKPIHGVIPPLNAQQWQEEFAGYQKIPEYIQINRGMSLDEFKGIYWWEWSHRLLGRLIGVIFSAPFLFFLITGRLEKRRWIPLAVILALVGLEGLVGWWMVASGLSVRTDVSQYRLAFHLTLACVIFAAVMWVARALSPHRGRTMPGSRVSWFAAVIVFFALLQIFLGALVAGLDAGLSYNTWPLMDGSIIPDGLSTLKPIWLNSFENPKAVQFLHRMNAYLVWSLALIQMFWLTSAAPGSTHANRGIVFFVLVSAQAFLGVATLVMQVPLHLALTHQAGALIVLGFAVAHWRGFYGEYNRPAGIEIRN